MPVPDLIHNYNTSIFRNLINQLMKNKKPITEFIRDIIEANRFAVLATECDGQPHASLVAVTSAEDDKNLIFATYRTTRKYTNLIQNGKVAILFENRNIINLHENEIHVLTAFGYTSEIKTDKAEVYRHLHLLRHPELESFLLNPDCAIFNVTVDAYQVVTGIDDVIWWKTDGSASSD
jgi:nitroimidazol reductase NimA-like FMN-containing flavoprotein (pyridoxamine 5'-phosphate oxidase superfamily)